MKTITMLTAMAGADFSYDAGQVIDIADNIAEAWIEAGLAEPAQPVAKLNAQIKTLKTQLEDKTGQVEGLIERVTTAEALAQASAAERDQLTDALAEAQGSASQYQDLLEASQKALAETQAALAEKTEALETAHAELDTALAAHETTKQAMTETEDRLTAATARALSAEQVVSNMEADSANASAA